jgi:hypothetical protein
MESMSIPRRTARAVFFGLGLLILFLTLAPFVTDANFRGAFARGNRLFDDLVTGLFDVGFGILFVLAALLVKHAGLLGLAVLTVCNLCLILAAIWSGADGRGVVLVIPLCLGLVALLVEDARSLGQRRSERT